MRDDKIANKQPIQRWKIIAFFIGTICLLTAASYAAYLYTKAEQVFNDSYEAIDPNHQRKQIETIKEETVSFLIMGMDARNPSEFSDASRTDALILATFDATEGTVKLLSIPRDTYTYIPGMDTYTKINHAHANGGTASAVATVEHLLEIPIDFYVKLNFQAFIEIVDVLNGVTVDVPYELYEMDSNDKKNAIHLLPGKQTVDGEAALAFARTRKYDNDIERGKRQQELIQAIMKKSAALESVLKYDDILDSIGANLKTNLSFNQIVDLSLYGITNDLTVETLTLEGTDYKPGDTYYWKVDEQQLEETKELLQTHLGRNETKTDEPA